MKNNISDNRFFDESIFHRRSAEWTRENIETIVSNAFKHVNEIPGWEFKSISWVSRDLSRREELKGHVYDILKVVVNEKTKTGEIKKVYEYPFQIPRLINRQYFYIGGFEKIPTFQLFDDPIIYRIKKNDSKILRFKNNLMSLTCLFEKNTDIKCNIFLNQSIRLVKKIPMELLIVNLMKESDYQNFFKTLDSKNETLRLIHSKCVNLWKTCDQKSLAEELGKYKINYIKTADLEKSCESIIFGITRGYEMDEFTKKFMKTDNIIKELLQAISDGPREDNDLKYKRIRFMEYILSNFIKKVYDFVCVLKYNKKIKIKITPTIILDECNVSSVVNHNFSYNPLDEVTSLLKCSLIGPGAFTKDNVPLHIKNIHDSHMGKICPVDTPDRDGCGVILNISPTAKIDENGKFMDGQSDIFCSMPITYVPFLRNNDQTRLQMSSSQQRQSINLVSNERPKVGSGTENLFLNHTNFIKKAPSDGMVVYRDEVKMVVAYDDGSCDCFEIGYINQHLDISDFRKSDFNEGDRFCKDDVLFRSNFINDENVCLGTNLLTGIAIWKGYNFEDGIILSKTASEKLGSLHHVDLSFEINPGQILMSLKNDEYLPIPKVGDCVLASEPYAKIKYTHSEILEHINLEPKELYTPHDCVVTNIEIYPNVWNQQIPQFDDFVKNLIISQNEKTEKIENSLKKFGTSNNEIKSLFTKNLMSRTATKNNKIGKYYEKSAKIKGIKIRIDAVYVSPLNVGDKISNRHGGKGVVTCILPDDQMPITEDGRKLNIILNPAGIISRINIGQLYELNMTESLYNLKKTMFEYQDVRSNDARIFTSLSEFCDIIDKTDDKWVKNRILSEFRNNCKQFDVKTAIDRIVLYQPPFKSISIDDLFKIMKFTNSKFKQKIYDPVENFWTDNPVAVGEMYFTKLVHRSSEKVFGRSIGPYVQSTMQPVSGKKNFGGHKLGEMEVWCVLAHGAKKTLEELLTTHSDSPYKKNKMLAEILNNKYILRNFDDENKERMKRPRSILLLESYLKILGINLKSG